IGGVAYFLTTNGSASDQSNKNNIASTKTTLPIPEILEDENPADDQAEYHLTAQKSLKAFVRGIETETYGYNGDYLGPVIRAKKGEEVTVHIQNDLGEEETTVHWHGLEIPGDRKSTRLNSSHVSISYAV